MKPIIEISVMRRADPFIEVADEATRVAGVLRVVSNALENPSIMQTDGLDDCVDCIRQAATDMEKICRLASANAQEIWRQAGVL